MSAHTITITIAPDGAVESEVAGVKGPTCENLLTFLLSLGEVTEDRPTGEYYEQEAQLDTMTW